MALTNTGIDIVTCRERDLSIHTNNQPDNENTPSGNVPLFQAK